MYNDVLGKKEPRWASEELIDGEEKIDWIKRVDESRIANFKILTDFVNTKYNSKFICDKVREFREDNEQKGGIYTDFIVKLLKDYDELEESVVKYKARELDRLVDFLIENFKEFLTKETFVDSTINILNRANEYEKQVCSECKYKKSFQAMKDMNKC